MYNILFKSIWLLLLIGILPCYGFDLPEPIINELEFAHIMPKPNLQIDSDGNIHLYYLATEFVENNIHEELRYVRFDGHTLNKIAEHIKGKGFPINADIYMFISKTGTVFCTFGYHGYIVLIFDESGALTTQKSLGGRATGACAGIMPSGKLLYAWQSRMAAFGIIDSDGNQDLIGSMERFILQQEIMRSSLCSMSSRQIVSFDGNRIYVIGHSAVVDPSLKTYNPKCLEHITVFIYDLNTDSFINYAEYNLITDNNIFRTQLEFDEIRIFTQNENQIDIFTDYRDTDGERKLCYFSINKELELINNEITAVERIESTRALIDPAIVHQLFWFNHSEVEGELGYFMRVILEEDKLGFSISETLTDGAHYKWEEIKQQQSRNLNK